MDCRSNASVAAAAAAAAAASQINAKLGLAGQQQAPPQMPPGMGMMATDNISVPDRMVGLGEWTRLVSSESLEYGLQ